VSELIAGITSTSQVLSVGSLGTVYEDFENSVKAYFGYGGGFASLFDGGETFSDGGTVFDGSALLSLMELVEFGFFCSRARE
jgi:hypothetical protein